MEDNKNRMYIQMPFFSKPFLVKRGWVLKIKIWHFYLYFSNCRMKKRAIRDYGERLKHTELIKKKESLYKQQGQICPICKQPFEVEKMEVHHCLPIARFPKLGGVKSNMIVLCHQCHKEIHCNPYRNIAMMEAKAKELNINIRDYYDY